MKRDRIIKNGFVQIILGLMALLIIGGVVAAPNSGQTSADFLRIGHGARAAGLGGAYTAISEGAIAAYWNPAGLSEMDYSQASLAHFLWYQDIKVEQGVIAFPLSESMTMAVSATYVNYGLIDGYDQNGESTGALSVYDWAGTISFGMAVTDHLSAGFSAKYINQSLAEVKGTAFAGDFGLKYKLPAITFAATVTNLGSGVKFDQTTEKLPTAYRFGIATAPFMSSLTTTFEFESQATGDIVLHQGIELGFSDQYYLRTGYDYLPSQNGRANAMGISVGAGLNFNFGYLDYAFALHDKSTSESLHRFSLGFNFGH